VAQTRCVGPIAHHVLTSRRLIISTAEVGPKCFSSEPHHTCTLPFCRWTSWTWSWQLPAIDAIIFSSDAYSRSVNF